jgi:hypothetical protein
VLNEVVVVVVGEAGRLPGLVDVVVVGGNISEGVSISVQLTQDLVTGLALMVRPNRDM